MIDFERLLAELGDCAPEAEGAPRLVRKLGELVLPKTDDPNELLRHRYLSRGGGLLLVGPTGIGKSSLAMQCMVLWALGRACFGIQPTRPLKSLLIQAENDDGDLVEMRNGVIAGLKLTPEEAKQAMENIHVVREDARVSMGFFQNTVRPAIQKVRPDLLWIDPALAYLGGEASSQKDVGGFLRNMLNPLLQEFNCGGVVVHHTNKPPAGREKSDWGGSDFAYLGSGSIEWSGWARAVLAVRSLGSNSVFELRAAKRGARLRWKEKDELTPAYARLIAHSNVPGEICWREAEECEVPEKAGPQRAPTKEDLLALVPLDKPIGKNVLKSDANLHGIALNKFNAMVEVLLAEGALHEWKEKRARTNPKISLARFPQPEPKLEL